MLWDMPIQCGNVIKVRKPGIVVVDQKIKGCLIVDIVINTDVSRLKAKGENWKISGFQEGNRKIWNLRV